MELDIEEDNPRLVEELGVPCPRPGRENTAKPVALAKSVLSCLDFASASRINPCLGVASAKLTSRDPSSKIAGGITLKNLRVPSSQTILYNRSETARSQAFERSTGGHHKTTRRCERAHQQVLVPNSLIRPPPKATRYSVLVHRTRHLLEPHRREIYTTTQLESAGAAEIWLRSP